MASILDRYGIKEVADVTFYKINDDGTVGAPALFLDTLKVSTIEQSAETTEARGGKGNPVLISWDYGKEINVSIEDALFSPKSLAIMFGNGTVATNASDFVKKTVAVRVDKNGKLPIYVTTDVATKNGDNVTSQRTKLYIESAAVSHADGVSLASYSSKIVLGGTYSEAGATIDSAVTASTWVTNTTTGTAYSAYAGQKVFLTFTEAATTKTITIDANTFPGTYYVTGDTYARSDISGSDQFFQFIIAKAKMQAENTITLEAEGDPSVFNMSLKVMRPESGEMMKLVQYDLTAPA